MSAGRGARRWLSPMRRCIRRASAASCCARLFLGTRDELEWTFIGGLRRFYPDLNDDFLSLLPPDERDQPLDAYWRRILDPDPAVHGPASRAWHDTERILSEHKPSKTRLDLAAVANGGRGLPSSPFMEAHYFQNDCFMKPGQLLENAGRLRAFRSCRARPLRPPVSAVDCPCAACGVARCPATNG